MALPTCAGDVITSAEINRISTEAVDHPDWTASDFEGDPEQPVALSDTAWAVTGGDYSQLAVASIDIFSDEGGYGAVVEFEELQKLPKGMFSVEGRPMTLAEYRDEFAC
ncbi:hypothetical protein ACWFNE_02540 [Cellulomonas sp. NPDC055163]